MILSKFANKSFFVRLGSGIVLIAFLLLTIIPGGEVLFFANLAISLIGVFELYRVFGIEKNSIGVTGYLFTVLYYAMIHAGGIRKEDGVVLAMSLIALFLILLLAQYVFLFPKYKTEQISNALLGMIYAGMMLSYIYLVRQDMDGVYNVWLIFICSWGSDTCAYVAGVAFGKHKMAPVLSPKKSIEGAVGGVLGAAILGAVYGNLVSEHMIRSAGKALLPPVLLFAVIGAVGALISMIGDLAASAIKRNHDIKDYGHLIPGHGGIMDRFDSVIYVAPIVWLLLWLFK